MVSDEELTERLRHALAVASDGVEPPRDLHDRVMRELDNPPRRRRRGWLSRAGRRFGRGAPAPARAFLPALGSAVAIAVLAIAVLSVGTSRTGRHASGSGRASINRLSFRVGAGDRQAVAVARILRARLRLLGLHGTVAATGEEIDLSLTGPDRTLGNPAVRLLIQPGRLAIFDWEANVLTPNDRTVAAQLRSHDPSAIVISQGSPVHVAGSVGAGSSGLYTAVRRAEHVPAPPVGSFNTHTTALYYAFGSADTATCRRASAVRQLNRGSSQPCYLAGPATTMKALRAALAGVGRASDVQILAVPRGVDVIQAVTSQFGGRPSPADPTAQFYVILDHPSLTGTALTHELAGADQGGSPDVSFGFTPTGAATFMRMTKAISFRGSLDSTLNGPLFQHFAIALDDQLLTVPSIDFRQYPDGVTASVAEITGNFTATSARQLARLLRLGPLPRLELTSSGNS